MDSANGGQSQSDLQRQAAAAIARKKVLAAYASDAQKKAAPVGSDGHMKDTPVTTKINSESWKQYHSAWQNYYQKYYSEYYSKAAQNYIAKEKLKAERARAEEEELLSSVTKSSTKLDKNPGMALENGRTINEPMAEEETISQNLRRIIRKKATDNAKKSRRHRHLVPVLAGVTVVLIILFLQYNRLIFAPIMAYVSPGNAPASEIDAIDPTITTTVSPEPRLIIPKLNIDVPVTYNIPVSGVMNAMNHGVAHYRISGASAYPGEIGNFVITGHSAGDVYSSNPYKYIFSGLERLEDGDLIYVNYNSVRYTYRVIKKEVIEPSDVDKLRVQTTKPLLTLITCTPLGTSRYRLLVTAEQISPGFDNATAPEELPTIDTSIEIEDALPSNEPGFFEGIWNWLTGQ